MSDGSLEEAKRIIQLLLDHLPNARASKGEDWDWCWNELSSDSQESVEKAFSEATKFLAENT